MRLRGQWIGAMAAAAVMVAAPHADAQSTSGNAGAKKAYDYAVRCFFADMRLVELFKHQGDKDQADKFEAFADAAFDGALKLGPRAGLSNAQMTVDLDATLSYEPKRLFNDPAYFQQTAQACKALGLM